MTNSSITDEIASTYLGKKVKGSQAYDSSLLVAVPREENRLNYNIDSSKLPFEGWDIWHCYEFSTMTANNIPITRVLKLRYLCESKFIIESKSLKLYLNSFNMSVFGGNIKECLSECKVIIENDLSKKLQTKVEVNFLEDNAPLQNVFQNYIDLYKYVDDEHLHVDDFKESPECLKVEKHKKSHEYYIKFDSLRSNCRVTHQPDFGTAFIYYKSTKLITYESLLKYLVSFRTEFHFHEECCEMIFKRLQDILEDGDDILVAALYTRRGGIDISPVRYTKGMCVDDILTLADLSLLARNGIKQ